MRRFFLFLFCISFALPAFAGQKFESGVYLRFRQEVMKNVWDFNSESPVFNDDSFFRIKASLWGKWNFSEDVSIFGKLTSEPKIFLDQNGFVSGGKDVKDEEIFFDNLYIDFKDFLGMPLDLRIGRQDFLMTHGEGFVIMDGHPFPGSRAFYFNAVKATLKKCNTHSLDIIYTQNTAQDEYLPVFNNLDRQVVAGDEKAFILYGRTKATENLLIEPYYIHKTEDAHTRTAAQIPISQLKLHTIGSRQVYNFSPWRLRGELAYQFGEYESGRDREGIGGYLFLTRFFNETKFSPSLDIGYSYLSGDSDPYANDGYDRGWNPVFSKWPWVSELHLFAYAIERGEPAYWTNLQLWRAKMDMKLTDTTGATFAYNYMRANENITHPFFGNGKERGHLPQIILSQKLTDNVDAGVWLEYFVPGNFYANRDNALFYRFQVQVRF